MYLLSMTTLLISGLGVFWSLRLLGVPGDPEAPAKLGELLGDCFLKAKSLSMSLASLRRGLGFARMSGSVGETGDTGVCMASLEMHFLLLQLCIGEYQVLKYWHII